MRDGSLARCQLSRLIRILLELQRRGYPNASDLGALCGVSVRTIHRDIEALRLAGVPIRYCHERLGYESSPRVRIEPPAFEREEILSIVWLTLGARGAAGIEVDSRAWDGLVKLVEAAGPEDREATRGLLGLATAPGAMANKSIGLELITALARREPIRLRIARGDGDVAASRFQAQRLQGGEGGWTLVGRSSADRGTVAIPVSAIAGVERLEP